MPGAALSASFRVREANGLPLWSSRAVWGLFFLPVTDLLPA